MRVHVERVGDGPSMVFTHGIGVTSEGWRAVAEHLAPRFTSVLWDLLGHGDSPTPAEPEAYDRDRVIADLDDVVRTCPDAPVMVGHSLGGYLTLAWAITHPGAYRKLAVLATGPGFRDPEKRRAWNERSRRNAHRFGVEPQVAEMNLQNDALVIERLDELEAPVLLIVGSDDRPDMLGGLQYLEHKLPDAHLVVLHGGGHLMHEDTHAAEVAELLAEFA
jgi:pimeloyl-ACP methyl ester carboxylesterase